MLRAVLGQRLFANAREVCGLFRIQLRLGRWTALSAEEFQHLFLQDGDSFLSLSDRFDNGKEIWMELLHIR
jgi:hypothetical protein